MRFEGEHMGRRPRPSTAKSESATAWLEYLLDSGTKELTLATELNLVWDGGTRLGQPDISKWKRDPATIPLARLPDLRALLDARICANLGCEAGAGPVYLCNLHPPYNEGRAAEAEERLMSLLRVQLPPKSSGLTIAFFRARIAAGAGAQCLANRRERPNAFFVLIEAERDETTPLCFADLTVGEQTIALKEIRAHVFTNRHSVASKTIKE
jgi:hypothetical protein